jgi:ketosteroid isomerase-like protein
MNTLEIVQDIFAAFGRGDVPAVLAHLSPEIEWDLEQSGAAAELPWLRPRRGLEEVAGFFTDFAEHVEMLRFEPRAFYVTAEGDVADVFFMEGRVRRTGRTVVDAADMHLWTFDASGKVVRFRHVVDTWQHVQAWRG